MSNVKKAVRAFNRWMDHHIEEMYAAAMADECDYAIDYGEFGRRDDPKYNVATFQHSEVALEQIAARYGITPLTLDAAIVEAGYETLDHLLYSRED